MNQTTPLTRIGQYTLTGILGEGAMGVVYRALDPATRQPLAIKTIRRASADDADGFDLCERFKREGIAGASLTHPNVVKVHEYGEEGALAYIVMDFVDGNSLRTLNARKGRWPLHEALDLAGQLLAALDYFHTRGIVHRDIKPSNIMVDEKNHLTVTDFGIAHVENSTLTKVGTILGTPWYMSPEQITEMPIDGRSDLFSVGIILYEMLTGRNPFKAEQLMTILDRIVREPHAPPTAIVAGLPPAIDRLFERALAKQPADRFQNGEEFRAALRQMQTEAAPPPGTRHAAALAALEISMQDKTVRDKPRAHTLIWLVAGLAIAATLLMLLDGGMPETPQPAKPAVVAKKPAIRANAEPAPGAMEKPAEEAPAAAATPAAGQPEAMTPEEALVAEITRQCESPKVERVLIPDINGIVRCAKSALCAQDAESLLAFHRKLNAMLAPGSATRKAEVAAFIAQAGCIPPQAGGSATQSR